MVMRFSSVLFLALCLAMGTSAQGAYVVLPGDLFTGSGAGGSNAFKVTAGPADGTSSTIIGTNSEGSGSPNAVYYDPTGHYLYTFTNNSATIKRYALDGATWGNASIVSPQNQATDILAHSNGNIYYTESLGAGGGGIDRVNVDGSGNFTSTTFLKDFGENTTSLLEDTNGDILAVVGGGPPARIVRYDIAGNSFINLGTNLPGSLWAIALDPDTPGVLYGTERTGGGTIGIYSYDATSLTRTGTLTSGGSLTNGIWDIEADGLGNLYVAVGDVSQRVVKIDISTGTQTAITVANSGFIYGLALDTAPVPEPSTFVLGLLGMAGLGLVGWRKKHARG